MRHGNKDNHLGRKVGHRRALFKNLAHALIRHKRITTTIAKAKALRVYIEPLVTKAKNNTTHSRRVVFGYLQNKDAVKELFGPIAEKVGDRPGGYVRIIRTGFRKGDGAEMALIEFVDFNEIYASGKKAEEKQGGKRKRRRGGSGSQNQGAADRTASAVDTVVIEDEVEEMPTVDAMEEAVADALETSTEETEATPEAESETKE